MFFSRAATLLSALFAAKYALAVPTPVEDVNGLLEPRAPGNPRAVGRLFNIDGKTGYYSGVNTWWLGHLWQNSQVDQALDQISKSGYKVVRVWAFGNTNNPATETNIYYQTLNSTGRFINYDPRNGLPHLDYVVSRAEKLGIKLVMTLLNNYDDLGGINTYTNAFGGSHNTFYTDARSQDAYKAYIKFIVQRYKNSCAIFSWELCNEPRCPQCSTDIIYNWASSISAYIKSLDPGHMVTLGDEGWLPNNVPGADGSYAYSGYEGVDFVRNLQIKTLDYGTFHSYPEQWGYSFDWNNKWIQQHNDVGKKIGKPVVFEEYGATSPELRARWLPEWQDTVVKKTSLAVDMVWQFATQLNDGNSPYDNYAIYYDTNPQSEFQKYGAKQAKAMNAKPPVANL